MSVFSESINKVVYLSNAPSNRTTEKKTTTTIQSRNGQIGQNVPRSQRKSLKNIALKCAVTSGKTLSKCAFLQNIKTTRCRNTDNMMRAVIAFPLLRKWMLDVDIDDGCVTYVFVCECEKEILRLSKCMYEGTFQMVFSEHVQTVHIVKAQM